MSDKQVGRKVGLGFLGILLLAGVAGVFFVLGAVMQPTWLNSAETAPAPVTNAAVSEVRIAPVAEGRNDDTQGAVSNGEPRAENGPTPPRDLTEEDLAVFLEVWRSIEQDFDGELPDTDTLNHAMVRGVLDTLDDPYTRFLDPELAAREREALEGSYEGIGAFVRENDEGFIEITRPIDEQPAQKAGLRAGDIIIGVDGEDVIGQGIEEVISKVRGPRDTAVRLLIAREGIEPFEVTIVRARVEIPVLETAFLEGDIAYLHLTTFAAYGIDTTVLETVEALMAQQPSGFIFDLRDNPGGFLEDSVNIADIFLPERVVLYERSLNGLFDETFTADDGDLGETIPLVVLINGGSASASELVAGALRDNDRAVLIGEQTFGKGSVQQIRTLGDGSELRLTVARWYTPDDHNINGEGIAPDIEIILDPGALLGSEEDNQLQRALDYLQNGE